MWTKGLTKLSLLQLLQTLICNNYEDQHIRTCSPIICMKMTYSQQLCNQSCVCLASTLSAYISIAPEQGRAGVSGAEWVTEGLMLALSEPSTPVKSSSGTTRTYWSTKLPSWLSFETKVKKSHRQPCWKWTRGKIWREGDRSKQNELVEKKEVLRVGEFILESGRLA